MSTTNILDLNNRIDALEKIAHNVEPIQQQIDELKAWTDPATKDASGNPIILTDGAELEPTALTVTLEESEDGYTDCNVYTLPNSDYATFFEGVKNGTHGFVDLGTLDWTYESDTTRFYSVALSDIDTSGWQHPENSIICGKLTTSKTPITDQSVDKSITFYTNKRIYAVDSDYTDATAFKTAMNGVYVIYKLETPTTPSYTIQQWTDLVNSFNGNVAVITFGETVNAGSVDFITGIVTVTSPEAKTLTLTPDNITLLKGLNVISSSGSISLSYHPDNLYSNDLVMNKRITAQDNRISALEEKMALLAGGDTGQVLTKTSGNDFDVAWETLPATRSTTKKSEK